MFIELDTNSKLGADIIKGDPHDISENGELLLNVIESNNLIVVNASNLCKGVITRQRVTEILNEKGVIDFVLVSEDLYNLINSMIIDEDQIYSLNRYSMEDGVTIKTKSDHNPIFVDMNIPWNIKQSHECEEMFNLKNIEGQR